MGKQTSHLPEGTLLSGRYRIVKFIGSGGFGCTYLADHLLFDTKVAIKEFFVSSLCNRDNTGVVSIGTESQTMIVEKLANKFLREARSLNKLSHPNIVRVSDVFEENGTNYYVMDYIEGRSLHAAMYYDGPLSEARMMNYMTQIMDALEYLHSRNMLHLDIKPDNIMVDAKDRAILIDFGVAKQYGDGTNDGNSTVMGQTPGFAPLEQMSNNVKAFSAATDIYALGATMYALLTGVTPPTAPELASGVAELQPLPPYISDNVRRTLAAMMEIKNSERLQSIAEVRSMLAGKPLPAGRKPGLGQQPTAKVGVGSVPHQPTKPLDDASAPQLPIDFSRVRDNRSSGKKKGLLIGIIAASAAILVGLGVFLFLQLAGSGKDKTDNIALTDTIATPDDTIDEEEIDQITDTEEENPAPAPSNNATQADTQTNTQVSTAGQASASAGTTAATTANESAATNNNTSTSTTSTNNNASASTASSGFISTPAISAPKYVDMGNGMYWASCNIGASSNHDSGWYFAWGEVNPKGSYSKNNYTLSGNSISNISGDPQYDPATQRWGKHWHVPTNQEWNKLLNNCTWEAQTNGVLLTSKINGNTIFLPNTGIKVQNGKKAVTYYWSSQLDGNKPKVIPICDEEGRTLTSAPYGASFAYYGLPIRPVYVP